MQQAVDYALIHYPAVRASMEQYNASRAGVGVARTNYLPSLNGAWQIDGDGRESVLGVLLSWEPFTFGYRHAKVLSAEATANGSQAQLTLTQLGVTSAVAEATLALLAQEQRVFASRTDVNRRKTAILSYLAVSAVLLVSLGPLLGREIFPYTPENQFHLLLAINYQSLRLALVALI